MHELHVHRYPPRYGAAPRLRALDVQEVHAQGQRLFALRKQGAPNDEPLLLTQEALMLAGFFDGTRDLRSVQLAVHAQYGQLLYCEKLHELALLLHRKGLFEAATPVRRGLRPARHAGRSYEADPLRLRAALDATYLHADGPGAPPGPWGGGARVAGIVSPDVDRASAVAAHAWKALVEGSDAELFVVLAAAPESSPVPVVLTRRDFDTPLGRVPTDQAAVDVLEEALGAGSVAHEALFDADGALEFAAVRLRHAAGERAVTMLPLLCTATTEAGTRRVLEALARAVQGRRVSFIASTSLSHVGAAYGDHTAPSPAELDALRLKDLASFERLARGDVEAFAAQVEADPFTRRIGGAGALSLLVRATGGRLRLLRYDQVTSAEAGSTVTVAAAVVEPA